MDYDGVEGVRENGRYDWIDRGMDQKAVVTLVHGSIVQMEILFTVLCRAKRQIAFAIIL